MKIKLLDKETSKWWSSQKDIIWAYRKGKDYWLIRPEEKSKLAPKNEKKKRIKQKFNLKHLCIASFIGAMTGVILSFALYIYLLIKNAL